LASEGLAMSYGIEPTDDEVDRMIGNYFPGSGLSSSVGKKLLNNLLSPKDGKLGPYDREEFFRRLIGSIYDSDRGRILRKSMLLRSCGLNTFQREPLYHILFRAIVLAGFASDGLPTAVEPIFWRDIEALVSRYDSGDLDESGMEKVLRLYTGGYTEQTWIVVQEQIGPAITPTAAYVFGGIYLERGEIDLAKQFLKLASTHPHADAEIIEAAKIKMLKVSQ
jgi:hypothetical protein